MKINNICPSLYHLSHFKHIERENKYPKISFEKSQYSYRIILLEYGIVDVLICGEVLRIEAPDALYLLPGDVYSLLPCGSDFSLYNLFFDFCNHGIVSDNRYKSCVFMQNFNAQLCLPRIYFEDAPTLNKSGIFKNIFDEKLESLLCINRADSIHSLYERSMLLSVIANMLSSERGNKVKSAVHRILEYIKCNPENDLSADSLSSLFSYHKNHINKLIKRETGRSLSEYIRYVKIEYAKTLMLEYGASLTEISARLGYFDYSHFYKAFYKETGINPTEYIKTLIHSQ